MENILHVDIPIQMISCTDTNGRITPIKFRFINQTEELITVTIEKVLSNDQHTNKVYANFSCCAFVYDSQKTFQVSYNCRTHEWRLSGLYF